MRRASLFVALSLLSLTACADEGLATPPTFVPGGDGGTTTPTPDGGTDAEPPPTKVPAIGPGLKLSVHTALGIPEPATPDDPEHALLVKAEYVTSFDTRRKNPRWTSWELTNAWLGTAERSTGFNADPDLPAGFAQATSSDYTNSGFHQGHLCPSADRTKSDAVNEATFVFTNVVPQTPASNLGPWKSLETQERTLATGGQHVHIIAGSLYAAESTIGDAVAVPTSMFKVVVALDSERFGPADVTAAAQVIAVDIPNTDAARGSYKNYLTSIADIEKRTGFHLLSDISPEIHDKLAAKPALP